jgi:hypothetical protein
VTPPGTRLILASENLFEQFGTRTDDGRKITAEWGEPTTEGWYSPTFTVTDDGYLLVSEAELATALDEHRHSPPGDWPCTSKDCSAAIFAAIVAAQEKGETG